jgi:integrase
MPRPTKPPRLWKRRERRDADGNITSRAAWIILDRGRHVRTGVEPDDIRGAEKALADYINKRHTDSIASAFRTADKIPVADVLNLYLQDIVPKHARPEATVLRLKRLAQFFGKKYLSEINGHLCRQYARSRESQSSARHDLEDLRAAINHHLEEGLHNTIIKVVLPPKETPRDRWMTRAEVAKLIRAAWRFKEPYNGKRSKRHIARFILIGIYTGTRAGVIVQTALQREPGRPYFDLDRGLYYRRPENAAESKKRRPTIPVPPRLLAHLRRWKRLGIKYAVEWNGRPIKRLDESFRFLVDEVGLEGQVTPHTLRHSCVTWLLQRGKKPWEVAGFVGMTVATLEKTYGHHHPDHLSDVLDAFNPQRFRNETPEPSMNKRCGS